MSSNTNYENNEQYYKDLNENLKKTMFSKQFPHLSFNDLQIYEEFAHTDDGCTHYLHKPTNFAFSWDSFDDKWIRRDNLNYLFGR